VRIDDGGSVVSLAVIVSHEGDVIGTPTSLLRRFVCGALA
jgi:hypothetical protein